MTFGKYRYSDKYEYELYRYTTKYGFTVVGGAEKLFKYFIKKYNPTSIISYSDRCKFSGKVYENLGMKYLKKTSPSYVYVNKHYNVINWKTLRDKGADNLIGTSYGKGTNNEEILLQNGYYKVFNSGNNVYVYLRKKVSNGE